MRCALATIILLGAGCFDPTFSDETRCGHAGDCPSGRECVGGLCLARIPDQPDSSPEPQADAPRIDARLFDAPPLADAPLPADGPPTGGFTQPPGTVAIDFTVDDTANAVYVDGDLLWKSTMIYDPATRTVAFSATWDGPWPPLFDDGPWNAGTPPGHEPIGSVAGDHRWGVTVFATPPATGTTRHEYGLTDAAYERAFGNGWSWTGANGVLTVSAGDTQPITAPGRTFPPFGAIDLQIVLDTRALDDRRVWDVSTVAVRSSIWGWGALPMAIAADGKATLTLSAIAGPGKPLYHTGLLDVGDGPELAFFLGAAGEAYADSRTRALTRGLTIAIKRPGAPQFVAMPFTVVSQNISAEIHPPGHTVTIEVVAPEGARGSVTSAPEGMSCPPTCAVEFPPEAPFVLSATPAPDAGFAGWSNPPCPGLGPCSLLATHDMFLTARFMPPNVMFVSSTTHDGNLGGLAGADAICQGRAASRGLPGTFRAWLSTSSVNAITRLGSASGWVRVDGRPVADSLQDLGNGRLFYPPRLDELGNDLGTAPVMTNTTIGGVVHPNAGGDCAAFTSRSAGNTGGGFSSASSYMFENYMYDSCASSWRIYCFGVDRAVRIVPAPLPGSRKVFQRLWAPGGGIASADAACQASAEAAGLSGTFRALLATSGASALSRFDLGGRPWARVDHVVILPAAAAWATATYFDSGPNLTADGTTNFGNHAHWAGATNMTAPGSAASTCGDWTDRGATAASGISGDTRAAIFFGYQTTQCSFDQATLTCLEL